MDTPRVLQLFCKVCLTITPHYDPTSPGTYNQSGCMCCSALREIGLREPEKVVRNQW